MAVPLGYSLRSVVARWRSALVAVIGIAGTVGVFVVVLGMAQGFRTTVAGSGEEGSALVLRGGASAEMESAVDIDQVRVIADAPGIARSDAGQPLVSAEVVVVAAFPLVSSGTDANVQVRGVSPLALEVRPRVRLTAGRVFEPGRNELIIGRNVERTYSGFRLGQPIRFGGGEWTVVGVFDSGGGAFDSEVWCDAIVLNQVYKRPERIFQSVTVRLTSVDAFQGLKDALTADPRLTVSVEREAGYYARQSRTVTTLIEVLGTMVAVVMAFGAVLAALNTMYSAVAARGREIATLRAIGFSPAGILVAFMVESLLVALAGAFVGCLAAIPFNGFTTGTMNWQTFSHLAFAFHITPAILALGVLFALAMGLLGGLPPALRAARIPVVVALREL
jgi:putative ABC transport system permease protein